jgi:type IV secretory pathway protease TraF
MYDLSTGSYPVFDSLSGNHFNPLTTVNMIIPADCYFVHGQQQPSFDSRYKEFGLICKQQIYGKTYPVF